MVALTGRNWEGVPAALGVLGGSGRLPVAGADRGGSAYAVQGSEYVVLQITF